MSVSKRLRVALLLMSLAIALLGALSHKYLWMYASRKLKSGPLATRFSRGSADENNPDALLAEANRLAWLFNWPKAEPLYIRAEELFKEKGDTRNEIYARVGRIRAQSETMSYVDVSQMIDKEIARPVTKSDPNAKALVSRPEGIYGPRNQRRICQASMVRSEDTRAFARRNAMGITRGRGARDHRFLGRRQQTSCDYGG